MHEGLPKAPDPREVLGILMKIAGIIGEIGILLKKRNSPEELKRIQAQLAEQEEKLHQQEKVIKQLNQNNQTPDTKQINSLLNQQYQKVQNNMTDLKSEINHKEKLQQPFSTKLTKL